MEVEDLEGRTVKEAKTIYDGGIETIIVTFDDGGRIECLSEFRTSLNNYRI